MNTLKKHLRLGILGSQYSLKPTLSFHFLPKFLAEVAYNFNDFETGIKACETFLTSTKFNKPGEESWNLMNNWYSIHKHLHKAPLPNMNPIEMELPVFCIVTDGGWDNWTGSDILTKGLGGSETWIIQMAKYISETGKYNVVVFCKTDSPRFFEKVGYNPIELFGNFIANNLVEYCIISRYTEYIPLALRGHAKNVGVIFHDMLAPEMIIPVHYKLKWVWGLTDWHSKVIKSTFPQFEKKVDYINYGIDTENFEVHGSKIKNSFIYSSFPNRGLVVLLRMWPKIVKRFPDATLNIFCDLEHEWTNKVAPDMMNEIKKLLKINKTGITNHGWVSKPVLRDYYKMTEYLLYPCIFEETFCLTVMEAAISKTCVITNGLAALSETAKNGITIPGDPLTHEWQVNCLKTLFYVMENNKSDTIDSNYQWASSMSWKTQAELFLQKITSI